MQLHVWRKRKKWSLRRMAEALTSEVGDRGPCAASTVLGWETGGSAPSLFYAWAIHKVTKGEVSLRDLVVMAGGEP